MKSNFKLNIKVTALPDEDCNPKVVADMNIDFSHEIGIGEIVELANTHGTKVKSTLDEFLKAQATIRGEVLLWKEMMETGKNPEIK